MEDDDKTQAVPPPVPREGYMSASRIGDLLFDGVASLDAGPETAGDTIGPYRLLDQLGVGGFGVVWRALQTVPIRREVALKVVKPGMDSLEIIARFEAERQALALMDHPNIAAVLDAGTTASGRPYFAMELVKGVPLTQYCDEQRLTIRERIELFIPVCQAVQHAHQKAILHRDLKPSNILVTEVDGRPVPKVIDFGIAKALGASPEAVFQVSLMQTQVGMVIGTPQYMSPEQAGSVPDVDTRSDIYTLGVILYELLTGQTPLRPEQIKQAALDEMLRLIREDEAKRPSSRFMPATDLARTTASVRQTDPKKLGHNLRGDLDWIVLKALEKDRSRRYGTANAFAQDLQRHLSDEPVSAGPPGTGYRLKKLIRRNKAAVALACLALLSLFGFLILVSINSAQVRRERNHALQQEQEANRQRDRSDQLFTKSLLTRAEELLGANDTAGGLAHLAFVLRRHPEDRATAARLLSALRDRSHARIIQGSLRHDSPVKIEGWTSAGQTLMTSRISGGNGECHLWKIESGAHEVRPMPGIVQSVSSDMSKAVVRLDKTPRGIFQLFDLETGRAASPEMPLVTSGEGITRHGNDAILSKCGRWLLTRGASSIVAVWDVSTGKQAWSHRGNGGAYASSCSFSRYGDIIAAGYPDGTLVVAALTEGRWKTLNVTKMDDSAITEVKIDRTGRLIAAQCEGRKSALLFLNLGKEKPETPVLHRETLIESFAFSPDGKHLALTQMEKPVEIWDLATSQITHQLSPGEYVNRIVYSDDGSLLATMTKSSVQIWNAWTGIEMTRTPRMLTTVTDASFSPDASKVAVSTADGRTLVLSTQPTKASPLLVPNAHWNKEEARTRAILHEDGVHFATCTWINEKQGNVSVYDLVTGKLAAPSIQTDYGIWDIAFQPHSDEIWIAGANRSADAWNWKQGKLLAKLGSHSRWVGNVDLDESGKRILISATPLKGQLWDTQTKKMVGREWPDLQSVTLSRDGRSVAMLNYDSGSMGIYSAETHVLTSSPLEHGGAVSHHCLAEDWSTALTVGQSGEMKLWNLKDGILLSGRMRHEGSVSNSAFSKGGEWIATASGDHTARIWSARDGRPQGPPLRHASSVYDAEFAPGDERVGTVSHDNTARVWEVASCRPLTEPLALFGTNYSCIWHPDGRRFISVGQVMSACWEVPPVVIAAPSWLPGWAETVGGARLDENGDLEAVDITRQEEYHKLSTTLAGDDIFTTTLRWFYAPLKGRGLSPGSGLKREDMTALLAGGANLPVISQWTSFAPEDAGSWAFIAWNLLYAGSQRFDDSLETGEWLIDVAARRDDNAPLLWLARAALHAQRKQMDDAEQCCVKGLATSPDVPIREMLREYLARVCLDHAKAAQARDILLDLVGDSSSIKLHDAVRRERMGLLRLAYLNLGLHAEAGDLNCTLLNIPPRLRDTPKALLNLSPNYNSRLDESNSDSRHSFHEVPSGVHRFGDVSFDVRGTIRLSNEKGSKYPAKTENIPIGRNCTRIHFLHASESTFGQKDIGAYVIHYEDGKDMRIPLVNGKNIADRYYFPSKGGKPYPTPLSPLVVGWQGENAFTRSNGTTHLWVFLHTWENPRPEAAIKSMDALSNGTAPLCIFGITTE